jgi:hypothetical protein
MRKNGAATVRANMKAMVSYFALHDLVTMVGEVETQLSQGVGSKLNTNSQFLSAQRLMRT